MAVKIHIVRFSLVNFSELQEMAWYSSFMPTKEVVGEQSW